MHLTNYAINKHSAKFLPEHKKTLADVWSLLGEMGYDCDTIWGQIQSMVVKTLLWV